MSKKTDELLRTGAELHWPGSGEHLLAVYHFLRRGGRSNGLGAAMEMNLLLVGMGYEDVAAYRKKRLASIRTDVEQRQPKRKGPTMDTYNSAIAALGALERMLPLDAAQTPE